MTELQPVEPAPATLGRGFTRDALVMVVGSVAAQGVIVLSMPILSRLYSPEAIGIQALFMSVAGLLTVLATLRLDLAVVLPRDPAKARSILSVGTYQAIFVAAMVGSAALVAAEHMGRSLSPEVASTAWIWMLAPMVIAMTIVQMGIGLATRAGKFGTIISANAVLNAVFVFVAIVIGVISSPDTGPVLGRLVGQLCAAGLMILALRLALSHLFKVRTFREVREVWSQQRQFIFFNTPYSFIGATARDLPIYVFSIGGGAVVVASYALARTVVLAPISLVSSALSSVFYKEAAEHLGTPRLEGLALSLARAGLLVTIPSFALILVWGDQLFEMVFGAPWLNAGEFAQRLAVPLWLAFQTGWPQRLFEAAGRQRVSFVIQISFDALHAVVIIATYVLTGDALLAVGLYAVTLSLFHLTYLVAVSKIAGFDLAPLFRLLGTAFGGFAAVALGLVLMRATLGESGWSGISLSVTVAVLLTLGLGVFTARGMRRQVKAI